MHRKTLYAAQQRPRAVAKAAPRTIPLYAVAASGIIALIISLALRGLA